MTRWWRDWHESPDLARRAASPAGQAVVLLAGVLLTSPDLRWPALPVLLAVFLAPARRVELLALGSLYVLYRKLPAPVLDGGPLAVAVGLLLGLGLAWLAFVAARRFARLPAIVRRHPLVATHAVALSLLGLGFVAARSADPGRVSGVAAATLAALVPFVLWRASYLMLSGKRGSVAGTRLRDHLMYWFPSWGGSPTPYGKGWDYLRARRVDDPLELAQTRLAGLKVLLLAWLWVVVGEVFSAAVYGRPGASYPALLAGWSLGLPTLPAAIDAGPDQAALGTRWAILFAGFLWTTLQFTITGHFIVGLLRLFGFRVFRNTYKPLLAPTIVEFWNRFYYYFKELLVEFFFFPTFVATAGRPRQVRIVLAIFAAAAVGNLYYHVVRDFQDYFLDGRWAMLQRLGGRMIYSAGLGIGVAVSMLREQRRRGALAVAEPTSRLVLARRIGGVWLFYSLLHVWNVGLASLSLAERTAFMLGLFVP